MTFQSTKHERKAGNQAALNFPEQNVGIVIAPVIGLQAENAQISWTPEPDIKSFQQPTHAKSCRHAACQEML